MASVMKRERLSFRSSHIFASSHIKEPRRWVVISMQTHTQLLVHIVSLTEPISYSEVLFPLLRNLTWQQM
jgi:hypothetical protein